MLIGNAGYQCSCVRYVLQDDIPLIAGLSVGFGLLLIIIVVVVIVLCRIHHNYRLSRAEQVSDDSEKASTKQPSQVAGYSRRLPHGEAEYRLYTAGVQRPNAKYTKTLPNEGTHSSTGLSRQEIKYIRTLPNEDTHSSQGLPRQEVKYSKTLPHEETQYNGGLPRVGAKYNRQLPGQYHYIKDSPHRWGI